MSARSAIASSIMASSSTRRPASRGSTSRSRLASWSGTRATGAPRGVSGRRRRAPGAPDRAEGLRCVERSRCRALHRPPGRGLRRRDASHGVGAAWPRGCSPRHEELPGHPSRPSVHDRKRTDRGRRRPHQLARPPVAGSRLHGHSPARPKDRPYLDVLGCAERVAAKGTRTAMRHGSSTRHRRA